MGINIFKIFSIFLYIAQSLNSCWAGKKTEKNEENECTKCVDTIPNTLLPWNKTKTVTVFSRAAVFVCVGHSSSATVCAICKFLTLSVQLSRRLSLYLSLSLCLTTLDNRLSQSRAIFFHTPSLSSTLYSLSLSYLYFLLFLLLSVLCLALSVCALEIPLGQSKWLFK